MSKVLGKCVVCGEPIFEGEIEGLVEDSGIIQISFGYGSRRDTDYGKGYIHDICSAKLEKSFKQRLSWESPISNAILNLDQTIEKEEVVYDSTEEKED